MAGGVCIRRALAQAFAELTEENNRDVVGIHTSAGQSQALAGQVVEALGVATAVGDGNATATQEMTASIGEVVQAIASIAATAERSSASVREVSATAEELAAGVNEVSTSAQKLAGLATTLREAVQAFTLESGEPEQPSAHRGALSSPRVPRP